MVTQMVRIATTVLYRTTLCNAGLFVLNNTLYMTDFNETWHIGHTYTEFCPIDKGHFTQGPQLLFTAHIYPTTRPDYSNNASVTCISMCQFRPL